MNLPDADTAFYPGLEQYLKACAAESTMIPVERRQALERVSTYIKGILTKRNPARLTFICTHNSRRSQMARSGRILRRDTSASPAYLPSPEARNLRRSTRERSRHCRVRASKWTKPQQVKTRYTMCKPEMNLTRCARSPRRFSILRTHSAGFARS